MKFLYLILFLIPSIGICQFKSDSNVNSDSIKNRIGFAYGPSGLASQSVRIIGNLIMNKKYDSIKSLIDSSNPSLKYLSIRTCEFLVKKKRMVLSSNESDLINLIKKSKEEVEYRSGCTVKEVIRLDKLFKNKNHEVNKAFDYWINEFE